MTREEAITNLNMISVAFVEPVTKEQRKLIDDTFEMAIKALSQEPCDDAISREWLKTAIHNFYYGLKHTPTEEDIQAYIDAAPPVTQKPKDAEQKYGKWLHFAQSDDCSLCGYSTGKYGSPSKYCPNCGAKMESEVKENGLCSL